jgi:hypothetical protein
VATLKSITINGERYPCNEWVSEQSGQVIRHEWENGFLGGMGHLTRDSDDGYYVSNGFDATNFPYLRLRPGADVSLTLTSYGADSKEGTYGFIEQDTNAVDYLYILNGQYAWKINLSGTPVVDGANPGKDFGGTAVAGRPVLFDDGTSSLWRVSLGVNDNAQELTTVATTGNADTWNMLDDPTGLQASHFALIQDGAVLKLARTLAAGGHLSKVDLSTDADTFGDDFEVGEGTLVPADFLEAQGELMVLKDTGIWRFTVDGVARPIMGFHGRGATVNKSRVHFDGVNSWQTGPYTYWTHSTGLWRIVRNGAKTIGPEADPKWKTLTLDGFTPLKPGGNWHSFVSWGEWAYATFYDSLFHGRIQGDGTVLWHGVLFRAADSVLRCVLDETGPSLWVGDQSSAKIHQFSLDDDGSPKTTFGSKRGAASTSFQFWFPRINAGAGRLREQVQWRFMWCILENMPSNTAHAPVQLAFHKDGATASTNLGNTLTTDGRNTVAWTLGSNDLAYEIQPTIKITTAAGYAPATEDLRIRAFGVEGVAPQTYRVEIPLTKDELRGVGNLGVEGALKALRALKSAAQVNVREPGMNDTFSGYIKDIEEQALPEGWLLTLRVQRWDWSTDS